MIYDHYRQIPGSTRADILILDPPWNKTALKFDKMGFSHDLLIGHAKEWCTKKTTIILFAPPDLWAEKYRHTFQQLYQYVWAKQVGVGFGTKSPIKQHEFIWVMSLNNSTGRHYDKMAARTYGHSNTSIRHAAKRVEEGSILHAQRNVTYEVKDGHREGTSILYYNKALWNHPDYNKHPTQKNLDLLIRLVNVHCPPGGTVVDPTAGSGTSAVAAYRTGRKYVIAESNPEYRDIITSRLEAML